MNWSGIVGPAALPELVDSAVQLAMPIGLAAAGEAFSERAGILNIGLEGVMLTGAFSSFVGTYYLGDPWLGLACGLAGGVMVAALMAFLSITQKTQQVINGIVIVLLAQGVTAFFYGRIFGLSSTPPRIEGLRTDVATYLSVGLVAGLWWLLFRTRFGLAVRSVGENPAAADAAGINVGRVRWISLLLSGAFAGLGGAVLVVAQLQFFNNNVTAGRGWVALAIVILGRWNPAWVLAGALLFGVTDALQLRVQAASGGLDASVPFELFQALPYLVTLAVMAIARVRATRDSEPAALGVPYETT